VGGPRRLGPSSRPRFCPDVATPLPALIPANGSVSLPSSSSKTLRLQLGTCCTPVPGDEICGLLQRRYSTLSVCRTCCRSLGSGSSERRVPANWDPSWTEWGASYSARLTIKMSEGAAVLPVLAGAAAELGSTITKFRATRRREGLMHAVLDLEVRDVLHLEQLIQALEALPMVASVVRPC